MPVPPVSGALPAPQASPAPPDGQDLSIPAQFVVELHAMGRAPSAVPEHVDRAIHDAIVSDHDVGGAASIGNAGNIGNMGRDVLVRARHGWRSGRGWRVAASIAVLLGAVAGWSGGPGSAPRSTAASELTRSQPSNTTPDLARATPRNGEVDAAHARPTVVDAMFAARIAAGANLNLTASRLARLDVDGDGRIEEQDARTLLRRVVDLPSDPSPQPGDDDPHGPAPRAGERGTT